MQPMPPPLHQPQQSFSSLKVLVVVLVVVGLVLVVLFAGVAVAGYFSYRKAEKVQIERHQAAEEEQRRILDERRKVELERRRRQAEVDAIDQEIAELTKTIESATDPAEVERLKAQLAAKHRARRAASSVAPPTGTVVCSPGDPLCLEP